jgi:hypothetical protein
MRRFVMITREEKGEWLALILNFERISFIGQPYKTFYLRNSRVFAISYCLSLAGLSRLV